MSRRSKYSAEEKLKIVEACLSGKIGVCEAGDRIGVDEMQRDYPRVCVNLLSGVELLEDELWGTQSGTGTQ